LANAERLADRHDVPRALQSGVAQCCTEDTLRSLPLSRTLRS
jgi:hypothetical protein